MLELLIATNNAHKLDEFRELFADLPLLLSSLADEGIVLDPEETGTTFQENAILKARAFAQVTEKVVLADDSGLEVDGLGGEPGVHSARYAHTAKEDHIGRYQIVLDKLAARNLSWAQRTARFKCVIALVAGPSLIGTVAGSIEGYISYEPKGQNGFGYDPIFYVSELGKTLAELTPAQKHSISHRGRAARAAIPLIKHVLKIED
jgi:XTP/dITP diphosphohydrolase